MSAAIDPVILGGLRADEVLAVLSGSSDLTAWIGSVPTPTVVGVGPPTASEWTRAVDLVGPGAELRCVIALSSLLVVARLATDSQTACPTCLLYWLATAGSHVRAIRNPDWMAATVGRVDLRELSQSRFVTVDVRTGDSTGHDVPTRHLACDRHRSHVAETQPGARAPHPRPPSVGTSTGLIVRTEVTRFPSEGGVGAAVATSWGRNPIFPLRPDDAQPLITTFGVSFDASTARRAAEWEAVERAAITMPTADRMLKTAAAVDLVAEAHIDPCSFGLSDAAADQIVALQEPDRYKRYRWLEGRDPDGMPIAIPDWSVFNTAGAPPIMAMTSNGVAAHPDRDEADERAGLETLERDAVLRAWYRQEPLTHYRTERLERVSGLIDSLAERGYSVSIACCGTQLPCAVALAVIAGSATVWPGICTGSAARWTDVDAVEHAILEATGSLAVALASRIEGRSASIPDIATPAHHSLWYRRRDSIAALESLTTPDSLVEPQPLPKVTPGIQALIPHLSAGEPRSVAFFDYSDPLSRAYGTHVVRCVAPGLLFLSFGQHSVRFDGSRGCSAALPPWPHPFT